MTDRRSFKVDWLATKLSDKAIHSEAERALASVRAGDECERIRLVIDVRREHTPSRVEEPLGFNWAINLEASTEYALTSLELYREGRITQDHYRARMRAIEEGDTDE